MDRRQFLKATTMAAAGTLLAPGKIAAPENDIRDRFHYPSDAERRGMDAYYDNLPPYDGYFLAAPLPAMAGYIAGDEIEKGLFPGKNVNDPNERLTLNVAIVNNLPADYKGPVSFAEMERTARAIFQEFNNDPACRMKVMFVSPDSPEPALVVQAISNTNRDAPLGSTYRYMEDIPGGGNKKPVFINLGSPQMLSEAYIGNALRHEVDHGVLGAYHPQHASQARGRGQGRNEEDHGAMLPSMFHTTVNLDPDNPNAKRIRPDLSVMNYYQRPDLPMNAWGLLDLQILDATIGNSEARNPHQVLYQSEALHQKGELIQPDEQHPGQQKIVIPTGAYKGIGSISRISFDPRFISEVSVFDDIQSPAKAYMHLRDGGATIGEVHLPATYMNNYVIFGPTDKLEGGKRKFIIPKNSPTQGNLYFVPENGKAGHNIIEGSNTFTNLQFLDPPEAVYRAKASETPGYLTLTSADGRDSIELTAGQSIRIQVYNPKKWRSPLEIKYPNIRSLPEPYADVFINEKDTIEQINEKLQTFTRANFVELPARSAAVSVTPPTQEESPFHGLAEALGKRFSRTPGGRA